MKVEIRLSFRITRDKPEKEEPEAPDIYDVTGAQVESGPLGFVPNEFKAEHIREED